MGLEPRFGLRLGDYGFWYINLRVTCVVTTKHIVTTVTVRNLKLSGVYPAHYMYYTHFSQGLGLGSFLRLLRTRSDYWSGSVSYSTSDSSALSETGSSAAAMPLAGSSFRLRRSCRRWVAQARARSGRGRPSRSTRPRPGSPSRTSRSALRVEIGRAHV